MNPLRFVPLISFLLVSGVFAAPPEFNEGESFDDFRVRWNAWVETLQQDERMYPDLAEVLDRISDNHRNSVLSEELHAWPHHVLSGARPWNEQWEHIDRVRIVFQADLDRMNEVAQRAYLGAPIPTTNDDEDHFDAVIPSDWVIRHSLDAVSPMRRSVQYLGVDAVYLAFNNKQDEAVARFQLLNRIIESTLELPGEIQLISRSAMRMSLASTMIELVEYDPDLFNDGQLMAMQSILHKQLNTDYRPVFEFEQLVTHEDWRLQFHSVDFARTNPELRAFYHQQTKIYTEGYFGDLLPDGIELELNAEIPLATLDHQISVQSQMLDAMLIDLAADPATQRMPKIHSAMQKHLGGRDASRFVPVFVDTGLWRSHLGMLHRFNYQTTNQIVVLAIHRHRARHGAWPASLAAIDPDTLPVPAIDLYSGEPLRYTVLNGKPRLWALGTDRDDDGGRPVWEDENDFSISATNWFALDEWDALSDERKAKYDGDLIIMD